MQRRLFDKRDSNGWVSFGDASGADEKPTITFRTASSDHSVCELSSACVLTDDGTDGVVLVEGMNDFVDKPPASYTEVRSWLRPETPKVVSGRFCSFCGARLTRHRRVAAKDDSGLMVASKPRRKGKPGVDQVVASFLDLIVGITPIYKSLKDYLEGVPQPDP